MLCSASLCRVTGSSSIALSGRRAEAARNDERILEAARAVFVDDPKAPIASVAEHAGVGISALYRRYPSKEDLLRRLCADGLERYIAVAEAALAREQAGGEWDAFVAFMDGIVEADTVSLVQPLAGTFQPTAELFQLSDRAHELNFALVERTRAAGALRSDIEVEDIALIFEALAGVRFPDPDRTLQLRRRYLRLFLDALSDASAGQPPGPPPSPTELSERWIRKS
jgi:AcrR family transcriptional regulator